MDEISFKTSRRIRPFTVPNFVTEIRPPRPRQEGPKFEEGIPLNELAAETLAELCDHFRAEVFKKAGRKDPAAGEFRR